jgi:hypothetical protein
VRYPAAALRLACAVLVALWALSASLPAPSAPSLTKPAREHAMLAAKRPTVAVAELASAHPAKHPFGSSDFPGLAGEGLCRRSFACAVTARYVAPQVPGQRRPTNLARAPPPSAAA